MNIPELEASMYKRNKEIESIGIIFAIVLVSSAIVFVVVICANRTSAGIKKYEQTLNQERAIESLPQRMVGK